MTTARPADIALDGYANEGPEDDGESSRSVVLALAVVVVENGEQIHGIPSSSAGGAAATSLGGSGTA